MAAIIRSRRNSIDAIVGASRNDLVIADTIDVESVDAATTYAWILQYAPEGSTATFSGSTTAPAPGFFTVDVEGAYLIRLTVDAGLPSEDTQFVRLRALTEFGQLKLVSAGERRDTSGVIPVDVDIVGWADEQNFNINRLLGFVKPMVMSGRVFHVDLNDGTEGYADYALIQDAINAALTAGATTANPYLLLIRPGVYVEDLIIPEGIHLQGFPGQTAREQSMTVIRGSHEVNPTLATDRVVLSNLSFETVTVAPALSLSPHVTVGTIILHGCQIRQRTIGAGVGPAVVATAGVTKFIQCELSVDPGNANDRFVFTQPGSGSPCTVEFRDSTLTGPSLMDLNSNLVGGVTTTILQSVLVMTGTAGALGIRSSADTLLIEHTSLEPQTGTVPVPLTIHPSAAVIPWPVQVELRWSRIAGSVDFDITNIGGTTSLLIGATDTGALSFPAGAPVTYEATVDAFSLFYDNTVIGALIAKNVQDAIDEVAILAAIAPVVYHKNMPAVADDTVRYRGWAPVASELLFVRVYIQDKGSSAGTYTLTVTNEGTGNTCLSAATFDMYSAVAGAVTSVALTAVPADLAFSTQDAWTIELTSDDPGFDADSVYVSLVFNTATGSGGVVEDLATTLAVGNVTAGRDIIVSSSDRITGVDAAAASGDPGLDLVLRGGLGDGAGVDGAVKIEGKLTVTGVIDPTGLILEQTPSTDPALVPTASQGTFFIPDGSSFPADVPNFVSASGAAVIPMLGGAVQGQSAAGGAPTSPTVSRASTLFQATVTATAVMNPTLPSANGTSGWVVYVEHLGDGTGTVNVTPNGADTLGGVAGTHPVAYESIVGFITTGGTDWRVLTVGGNGAPNDDHTISMVVSPGNTVNELLFAPYALTLVGVRAYCESGATSAAGVYTLAVEDIDLANNLLLPVTFNMETPGAAGSLPAATLTTVPLTGTTANLDLSQGTRVRIRLVSDNADLVATGVHIQLLFRAQ